MVIAPGLDAPAPPFTRVRAVLRLRGDRPLAKAEPYE